MISVLLYSHSFEPITQVLLNSFDQDGGGLIKISLSELLNNSCIFDEIDEQIKLSWNFSNGLKITNSDQHYLINRVLSIPEEIFSDFAKEDRSYSLSEFRAYLAFAIEAFPNSFAKPGAFGLSGNRFSLPRQ